ncbi:MAG TPA: NUDIX hydrolase [Methylophaga sp.]|nr:NUDIX hydrolase [Methylophaga sp.]
MTEKIAVAYNGYTGIVHAIDHSHGQQYTLCGHEWSMFPASTHGKASPEEVTCKNCLRSLDITPKPKQRFYNCPYLSVDIICMWKGNLVIIERKNKPHGYALPGGMVDYGETVEHAALRELKEETNLFANLVKLVGVYSNPSRDERTHIVTLAFAAIADRRNDLAAHDDAKDVFLLSPDQALELILIADHHQILKDAMDLVFSKARYFLFDKSIYS